MQVLAALVHHQTENLAPLPLFYGADPTLISNRLVNVHAKGGTFTQGVERAGVGPQERGRRL